MSDDIGVVDLRCPVNPKRRFAKILQSGAIVEGNLIEVACDDCRTKQRKLGQSNVTLVLHRFNVLGVCIESEVVRR